MKNKILIFTDCDFFAGCEGVIALIINSHYLNHKYDTSLIYRFSKNYEAGLLNRIDKISNISRIYLLIFNRSTLPNILRNIFIFRVIWRVIAILFSPFIFILNIINIYFKLHRYKNKEILLVNNGGYPASPNALLAIFFGHKLKFNKIFLTCNNTPTKKSNFFLLKYFQTCIDKNINKICTGVLVASKFNKKKLTERRFFDSDKIFVLPNGIEENRFNKNAIKLSRNKAFNNNSGITFGLIGVHEQRKGHMVLLKAIEIILRSEIKNFKVIIEGKGILTSRLKRYVQNNFLDEHVFFINNLPISSIYENIDVLVVPSLHSEDLPNIISEAMLFGIPVIGSNLAGIPYQIKNEKNGIIFPIGNEEILSEILTKFIKNPSIINRYKQNCIDTYYDKFDSEKYAKKLDVIIGEKA